VAVLIRKQQRQSLDENAPESFRGVFVFGLWNIGKAT
jgi:hypothetical protein